MLQLAELVVKIRFQKLQKLHLPKRYTTKSYLSISFSFFPSLVLDFTCLRFLLYFFQVLTNCKKNMSLTDQQSLRLIRDELFPSTQAWPLQLAAPYRNTFSSLISRLHASGLFSKWHADAMEVPQLIPKSHSGASSMTEVKFDLVTILGPALIWMTGIILSCVVFSLEVCYGIRKRRRLRRKIKKQKIALTFIRTLYNDKNRNGFLMEH